MNAVSLLITPKAQATGAAGRSQASREDQAAFSPALMMLLAAGLAPIPQSQAPTAGPDASATANAPGSEQSLDDATMNLHANPDQTAPGSNAQPGSLVAARGTSGALPIAEFTAVAPTPLAAAHPSSLASAPNAAPPNARHWSLERHRC